MTHAMYAAINIGKKSAGLDDETYRDLLDRETGKRSLRAMNFGELTKVRNALGHTKPAANSKRLSGPYAKKLQALWLSAWNLGIVRDRRDSAMLAFIKRQTGIERTEFLRDAVEAQKAVEALKSWIAREGGVVWRVGGNPQDDVIAAQLRLAPSWCVEGMTPITAMQFLGTHIRREK